MRRDGGFTLIEILVVIAIIAIIAGMTLAAMRNSQTKAKGVRCLNNLRQIGTAFSAYASDNDGTFPAHSDADATGDVDESVWSAKLVSGKYLAEPTGKADAIFLCPFDAAANDNYAEAYRSYAYNPGPDETLPVRVPVIENPASTIMLAEWFEPDPFASVGWHPLWDAAGYGWRRAGGLYAHHKDGTSSVLFYDLHVEAVKNYALIPDPAVSYKWDFTAAPATSK